MNLNLSIQFKKKELVNTKDLTLSTLQLVLLNDISFSVVIYLWYVLFHYIGVNTPNPFFALSISLLQNIIVFLYLLKNNHTAETLIKYTILLIILKVLPLISLYMYDQIGISYFDVYSTVYLYILYIFIIIIVHNIILHNNKNIVNTIGDDFNTDKYKKNVMDVVYDKSYNDVIKQII